MKHTYGGNIKMIISGTLAIPKRSVALRDHFTSCCNQSAHVTLPIRYRGIDETPRERLSWAPFLLVTSTVVHLPCQPPLAKGTLKLEGTFSPGH